MQLNSEQLKKRKLEHMSEEYYKKEQTITFQEAFQRCQRYITEREDNKIATSGTNPTEKRLSIIKSIDDFVDYKNKYLVDGFLDDIEALKKALRDEIVNYGILTDILDIDNSDVDEVQVNSLEDIFYVEKGVLKKLDARFRSAEEVKKVINKLTDKGDRPTKSKPFVNGRTEQQFRLNVTHPEISRSGHYTLTLRKKKKETIGQADIVVNGTVTRNMMKLMKLFVRGRANWMTVGGTGSGKTVLNNVLIQHIDKKFRCIYIENPTELEPAQTINGEVVNNFVQFEAISKDNPGPNDPTMLNLLENALRQTPNYIIPGEVRSEKEFDVALTAAKTGHNVVTTFHAEDTEDAANRFLSQVLKCNPNIPSELLLKDIASAFPFVINVERLEDGQRRVSEISELLPPDKDHPLDFRYNLIYKFVIDKVEEVVMENGEKQPKYFGRHVRVGKISPWFHSKLLRVGVPEEQFELFLRDIEYIRDEDGELILDRFGKPIEKEEEFEYRGMRPPLEELTKGRVQNGDAI